MPHIIIKLWSGKSEVQKKKLAEELVRTARSVIGYGQESFSVAIEDVHPEDWAEQVYRPDIIEKRGTLYKEPGYKM